MAWKKPFGDLFTIEKVNCWIMADILVSAIIIYNIDIEYFGNFMECILNIWRWGCNMKNYGMIVVLAMALIVLTVLTGCSAGNREPEGVLFILPEKGVDHVEFTTSKRLLEDNGIKVTLASTKTGEIIDDQNEKFQSSLLIKKAKAEDYELIAVMGGNGMKLIEKNEDVKKLLQAADKQGKYIGAICYGPVLLARAGILDGIEATVYPNGKNEKVLSENGALFKMEKMIVSGNIITAQGPVDSEDFGKKLVEILK